MILKNLSLLLLLLIIIIIILKDRKHTTKRRKCWLPAFSPFPTMFSQGSFRTKGRRKSELFGKRLM